MWPSSVTNNKMKYPVVFLIFFFYVFAQARGADKLNMLQGKWIFSTYECKNKKLGLLAKENMKSLNDGRTEEFYLISGNNVEHHLIERRDKDKKGYCETIFEGTWAISENYIKKTTLNLKSRKGKNGGACYEQYKPKSEAADRDWPFEIKGERLTIYHNDVSLIPKVGATAKHFCDGKSDVALIFQAQH